MDVSAVGFRLAASTLGGGLAAALGAIVDPWLAAIVGWIALAGIFSAWTWLTVGRLDSTETRRHASREDPTHAASRVILVLASLASVIGVGVLLLAGSPGGSSVPWEALVGVASVVASWTVVHLLYMLHYARLYYTDAAGGAVDFNGEGDPDYHDFADLAFTLGMTYQVSDTALKGREVRRVALRHALLSYMLGAVVLAVTINLVVQLASAG